MASDFTPREIKLAGVVIAVLRKCRDRNEAMNVVVIACKALIEPEARAALLPHLEARRG